MVKHFSITTVVFNKKSEEIKKKYLLKWAYKIHKNNLPYTDHQFLQKLIASFEMPLYVINSNANSITQTATITIKQLNSFEISISCSQYHFQIAQYFKSIFKDSMLLEIDKANFKITIKTKAHIQLLKNILSSREISNILVTFITHDLSFKQLHPENISSVEYLYREKLKKSYKLLSISDKSTSLEMKRNYRNMLKKYHPDIVYNQSDSLVQLYTKRFQVIQNAYAFLKEHHKIA